MPQISKSVGTASALRVFNRIETIDKVVTYSWKEFYDCIEHSLKPGGTDWLEKSNDIQKGFSEIKWALLRHWNGQSVMQLESRTFAGVRKIRICQHRRNAAKRFSG